MRLVQVTVPTGSYSAVEEALGARDIDFYCTPESSSQGYEAVVHFSLSEGEVESVLDDLYAAGLDENDHVVLLQSEADMFGQVDSQSTDGSNYERIASAELETKAEDLLPDKRTFAAMIVLSTIVATTGLLLDSAAVVVGAMVIAPLFGPAVTTSVGTVIDKETLFRHGIAYQVAGIVLAVVSAILFALILRNTPLTPPGLAIMTTEQIADRLAPDVLSLVVAFVAGIAGVLSLATGVATALVGVMIAAALLPPAATIGIGIAWGEPVVAVHAAILLLVNVLAINLAGLVTLWFVGYRPRSWVAIPQTRREIVKRAGLLVIAILVVSGFLLQITFANVQRTQTEDAVTDEVEQVLEQDRYANVTLTDVSVQRNESSLIPQTEQVTVTVARPPGERLHQLHPRIEQRLVERLDRNFTLQLRVTLVLTEDSGVVPANGGSEPVADGAANDTGPNMTETNESVDPRTDNSDPSMANDPSEANNSTQAGDNATQTSRITLAA